MKCEVCEKSRPDVKLTRWKTGVVRPVCAPCARRVAPKPAGGWEETGYARWDRDDPEGPNGLLNLDRYFGSGV